MQKNKKGIFSYPACIVIIFLAVWWFPGLAKEGMTATDEAIIYVKKSRQAVIYDMALQGFKDVLAQADIAVTYSVSVKGENLQSIGKKEPTLILVLGTGALAEASSQTSTIPIVFSSVMAAQQSLPQQANITGALINISAHAQLQAVRDALPDTEKIGVIYVPGENDAIMEDALKAANDLGIDLKTFAVQHARQIPQISRMDIDAMWMIPNTVTGQLPVVKHLLANCFRYRIPVMGLSASYVKAGALLAITPDYRDIGRQAGELALQILAGYRPDQLPVTAPRITQLFINQAVAGKLRLNLSQETLRKATQVLGDR